MEAVTIHKAKSTLSHLLVQVEAGEEVVLARGSQPIARIVPYDAVSNQRKAGSLRGLIAIGPAFFELLREAELTAWE